MVAPFTGASNFYKWEAIPKHVCDVPYGEIAVQMKDVCGQFKEANRAGLETAKECKLFGVLEETWRVNEI